MLNSLKNVPRFYERETVTRMAPLLLVADLKKHFWTSRGTVSAVDGVSFEIGVGETVGLVGESGCGKSTLGRAVARLIEPTSGSIEFDGQDITHLRQRALRPFRQKLQFIFQDPYASLNPRSTIYRILEEPLIVHGVRNPRERRERVEWLMARVGLDPSMTSKYPHEFSGGQRQRVGIARALMLNPKLIVCDEPVSALDVSIQAQILNLFSDLQQEFNLSYLFISHDLSVIKFISDRIMVMYLGKVVEIADHRFIWAQPFHPYTQILVSAIPVPDPKVARTRAPLIIDSDLPSPLNVPTGCRFNTRCPYTEEKCFHSEPELREAAPGHFVACHFVTTADGGTVLTPRDTKSIPAETVRSPVTIVT